MGRVSKGNHTAKGSVEKNLSPVGPNVKKPMWGTENEVLRLSLHHGLYSERGGIHIFRLVVRRTWSKTEGCVSNNLDLQLFTCEFDLMEVFHSHDGSEDFPCFSL